MLITTIREMHIKTMSYYLTPVRKTVIKKSTNNKICQGYGEKGTFLHCEWECKLVQQQWKTVWSFLQKLKLALPYCPAILHWVYIWKKNKSTNLKIYMHPNVHSSTIYNIRDEATQMSINRRIKKMSLYCGILAKKNNEVLPFAAMWMNLENINFGDVRQTEKDKYCISLVRGI